MKNSLIKLLIVFSLISSSFASTQISLPNESEILLSLERIKFQNEMLHKQYENIKGIEDSIDPKYNDAIIESLAQKVINDIEAHAKYQKNSAWGEVKEIVHHIKEEAKILSRKQGLAISIIIMTIELTELPMKALAVGIGSPVIIVLYEFLQPGILVPAIIIGVKNIAKTVKTKKLFQNKALYREWKNSEKIVKKQLRVKKGKNEISYLLDDESYMIKSSNLFNDIFKIVGISRARLDYKNLKRFIRRNRVSSTRLKLYMKANMNKQMKAKLMIDELIKLGYSDKLKLRFKRSKIDLKPVALNTDLTKWIFDLFNSNSREQTQHLFQNLPKSMSPLVFFELWESKIMEEFFTFNQQYKNKYYRKLQTKLLPIIVSLRKKALLSQQAPLWTSELDEEVRDYFSPVIN